MPKAIRTAIHHPCLCLVILLTRSPFLENLYANMHTPMSSQTLMPNQMYSSYANSTLQPDQAAMVDTLADTFGNVSLRNGHYSGQDTSGNSAMQANGNVSASSVNAKASNPFLYQLPDAGFAHGSFNPTSSNYRQFSQHYNWPGSHASQYDTGLLHSYLPPGISHSGGSNNQPWLAAQQVPPPPELRRTSWSSREEQSPQTPTTFGPGPSPGYGYTSWQSPVYSTPSPMAANNPMSHQHLWKQEDGDFIFVDYWKKMMESPPVPDPVPAIHSGPDGGRGTLDKILDNRDGTTNVYVRGLQPNTSDSMLNAYGERFGPVVSCKSIIDASTSTCKG